MDRSGWQKLYGADCAEDGSFGLQDQTFRAPGSGEPTSTSAHAPELSWLMALDYETSQLVPFSYYGELDEACELGFPGGKDS